MRDIKRSEEQRRLKEKTEKERIEKEVI